MNISLPETLKSFVDEQVSGRGYSSSSEYVRELLLKDQDRQHLRGLLLEGAEVDDAGHLRCGLLRSASQIGSSNPGRGDRERHRPNASRRGVKSTRPSSTIWTRHQRRLR